MASVEPFSLVSLCEYPRPVVLYRFVAPERRGGRETTPSQFVGLFRKGHLKDTCYVPPHQACGRREPPRMSVSESEGRFDREREAGRFLTSRTTRKTS